MDEIEKLKNLKCANERQEKNKDLFLFACFTGLAYIDIYYLKNNNIIIDPNGSKHIQRNRQKIGVLSIIPILLSVCYWNSNKFFVWSYPIPAYTHSSAASTRAFHKCKAKELRTITRYRNGAMWQTITGAFAMSPWETLATGKLFSRRS